jgi:K+-sensing histidine kinase KdpD
VHTEIDPDVELGGDALLLKLLISNLLENANKYSGKEKNIWLVLQKKQRTVLQVRDEGEGIPDAEKEAVFQSFTASVTNKPARQKAPGWDCTFAKKLLPCMALPFN